MKVRDLRIKLSTMNPNKEVWISRGGATTDASKVSEGDEIVTIK